MSNIFVDDRVKRMNNWFKNYESVFFLRKVYDFYLLLMFYDNIFILFKNIN